MTAMKTGSRTFVRMCGVVACVVAAASGSDADAGWRRRCCADPCCEPVCCETVRYEPVCCDTCAPVTVCEPRCVASYDSCGRRIETDCGCTVVRYRTIVTTPSCCEVAAGVGAERTTAAAPTLAGSGTRSAPVVKAVAARAGQRR